MAWINLSFAACAAFAESWCDALLSVGAIAASIEDADAGTPEETPQFGEPGMEIAQIWQHSRVNALFPESVDIAIALARAAATLQQDMPEPRLARVEEENWVQLTQAQFEPVRISENLWIVPSWRETPVPRAVNIALDPGMAFGTGTHPTTHLCLEWLEQEISLGMSMLDYGCGSGILAIAAAKLGAFPVDGIDIDPQAVAVAHANAEKNSVIVRFTTMPETLAAQYDLVVANILANPLRILAPAIAAHVRPGGKLALSGLLAEQAYEIAACYAPWITLDQTRLKEGWVCLSGTKKSKKNRRVT